MKKDPTIKQRKMQEISAKINNTAKEKLSHLPKVCSKFFYRTCVFRRASVCTSDPRNVLRVTAVLSSRSRKPELDSSNCICLEVICLSVTILLRLKPACTSRMAVAVIAADLSSVEAPKAKRSTDFYLIFFGQTGGAVTV